MQKWQTPRARGSTQDHQQRGPKCPGQPRMHGVTLLCTSFCVLRRRQPRMHGGQPDTDFSRGLLTVQTPGTRRTMYRLVPDPGNPGGNPCSETSQETQVSRPRKHRGPAPADQVQRDQRPPQQGRNQEAPPSHTGGQPKVSYSDMAKTGAKRVTKRYIVVSMGGQPRLDTTFNGTRSHTPNTRGQPIKA